MHIGRNTRLPETAAHLIRATAKKYVLANQALNSCSECRSGCSRCAPTTWQTTHSVSIASDQNYHSAVDKLLRSSASSCPPWQPLQSLLCSMHHMHRKLNRPALWKPPVAAARQKLAKQNPTALPQYNSSSCDAAQNLAHRQARNCQDCAAGGAQKRRQQQGLQHRAAHRRNSSAATKRADDHTHTVQTHRCRT